MKARCLLGAAGWAGLATLSIFWLVACGAKPSGSLDGFPQADGATQAGGLGIDTLAGGSVELNGGWQLWTPPHDIGQKTSSASAAGSSEDLSSGRWSRPGFDASGWRSITLPATWQDLGLDDYSGLVYLRRSVDLPRSLAGLAADGQLSILIGAARYGDYAVYANGREVAKVTAGGQVPSPRVRTFPMPASGLAADGSLVLGLRFHRVDWAYGGTGQVLGPVGEGIAVGHVSVLEQRRKLLILRQQQRGALPLALVGLAALIGLYHFGLAFRQRRWGRDAVFGLLAWLGWIFVYINEQGELFFPTHDLMRRALVLTSHLILLITVELVWRLLEEPKPDWAVAYQGSHAAIALSALFLPPALLSESLPWRLAWVAGIVIFLTYRLFKKARRSLAGERLWSWAATMLPLGICIDLIMQSHGFDGRFLFSNVALVGVGAISVLEASERFQRVHQDLEQLSQHLEMEVDDRTDELATTNRRLQSQIAERRLVEEALRMLERAVEQSEDGIAVTDLSGSTKFINEAWARMHGHDVYEVLGYEIGLFHTPEQMQEEVFPLMTWVRQHGSFQGEVGHRRKDGSTFPAWMSITRLRNDDGEAVGMVAIARDITEQRRAAADRLKLEKEAHQAERLESLAILAAGIAHDFNNLLTSVLGHASLLARHLTPGDTDHGRARQIEAAADRAAQLSDQLLSYAGEDQMAPQVQGLNDVVESLRSELLELIPAGVTLQFQLKQNLPKAKIDREQVHTILLSLVRNGVDALEGDDGVVTVRTSQVEATTSYFEGAFGDSGRPAGGYVFFEVSDSGRGIDKSTLAHIFDPFFTTRSDGRGLGLAASLGIVRAHGGAIKVYSEPRKGSTFEVLFPVTEEAESGVVDAREVRSWRGGGTILVADDEDLVREVAKDILEAQGFEVLTAENGRQAVRLFRKNRFDIRAVLLDLTMPQMDGEQAYRAMHLAQPEAKILMMSGYNKQQIRRRLEGEQIAGFLHKPFRPEDLLRLLREVLDPPEMP